MTFTKKISAYTLGLLGDRDLPTIAITGLEEGLDSVSLRILAGRDARDNPFQLIDYFKCVLKELNLLQPDRKSALIDVLEFHACPIAGGQIDAYSGFGLMDEIVEKTEFHYDDIGLKDCYLDYVSIWEVKSDGLQLHEGLELTREQFIDRTKAALVKHMSAWLIQIGRRGTSGSFASAVDE